MRRLIILGMAFVVGLAFSAGCSKSEPEPPKKLPTGRLPKAPIVKRT